MLRDQGFACSHRSLGEIGGGGGFGFEELLLDEAFEFGAFDFFAGGEIAGFFKEDEAVYSFEGEELKQNMGDGEGDGAQISFGAAIKEHRVLGGGEGVDNFFF